MKRVPHPTGVDILFDPKWHQYKLGDTTLRSVSKLLDRYFPFDEANVLRLVARKTGMAIETIKKNWSRQALLGKNIHAYIECRLMDQPLPAFTLLLNGVSPGDATRAANGAVKNAVKGDFTTAANGVLSDTAASEEAGLLHGEEGLYLPAVEAAITAVKARYEVLAVEQMIASPTWGLAGTIDLLAWNRSTGKVLLADWKTTGSVASSFRFGSFETPCTGSLRHLPNAKLYRYAMQLAIYGEILKQQRYFELGYFDAALRRALEASASSGTAKTKKSAGKVDLSSSHKEEIATKLEYGLVQFSKTDEGNVISEFKKVTEKTVLPPDDPETDFTQVMQKVMMGL